MAYIYKSIRVNGRVIDEHVAIAQNVLGRKLPDGAIVHHWDMNKKNNEKTNLAIFPNAAYHSLIHARMSSLKNTGHPDWLRCQRCKKWDDPKNGSMWVGKQKNGTYLIARHRYCQNEYLRNLRNRNTV